MTRKVSGLIVAAISLAILLTISLPVPINARECTSIDIRNNVANFNKLDGCTVIRGYLMIVLIKTNVSVSDYSNLTFPDLREITDFFILYDVKALVSLKRLFPNLTVIRGRRLFLNFALTVSSMSDLAALEFKSLIAIQHGSVYIASNPKLCFLEHVNWDRLTLSVGSNVVLPMAEDCPQTDCSGCGSGYCWSNMVCQKMENDNVVNLVLGSLHCHRECLGGCYNTTNTGCAVCKGMSDHGACVNTCPSDLYYSEHHQRCYTQQECGEVRGYVYKNQCNRRCPSGYNSSRRQLACIKCDDPSQCVKTCAAVMFKVFDLAGAEALKDCVRLNSSLYIQINAKVDETNFMRSFENLREVQGYIKVVRSPYLQSLDFLRNLKVIEGAELINNTYALLIYDNDSLERLWLPPDTKQLHIFNGSISIYSNIKLCNRDVKQFADNIIHDKEKDLLEVNDEDVLCNPTILHFMLEQASPTEVVVKWSRNETRHQIEVYYREALPAADQKQLDLHVCDKVDWKREFLFLPDLEGGLTYLRYILGGLKPFTMYEILVKTFQENNDYSARSVIKKIRTLPERPTAARVFTQAKTPNSITLAWESRAEGDELLSYYILEIYEQNVDLNALDSRNFCAKPAFISRGHFEDYDDCCNRLEEKQLDEEFKRDMDKEFPCTLLTKENCQNNDMAGRAAKIVSTKLSYEVRNLRYYTSYTFYFYGCNEAGCGSYYMYSDRTNYSVDADKVLTVSACRIPQTYVYHLQFNEPLYPNGAIVSYIIHFRNTNITARRLSDLRCITRSQHEMAGFEYVVKLNATYAQAAVRTTSLAGSELSEWFDIEACKNSDSPVGGIGVFSIFIVCCIICAAIGLGWISYRKKWWRRFLFLMMRRRREEIPFDEIPMDDRRMLVDRLERLERLERFENMQMQSVLD